MRNPAHRGRGSHLGSYLTLRLFRFPLEIGDREEKGLDPVVTNEGTFVPGLTPLRVRLVGRALVQLVDAALRGVELA